MLEPHGFSFFGSNLEDLCISDFLQLRELQKFRRLSKLSSNLLDTIAIPKKKKLKGLIGQKIYP